MIPLVGPRRAMKERGPLNRRQYHGLRKSAEDGTVDRTPDVQVLTCSRPARSHSRTTLRGVYRCTWPRGKVLPAPSQQPAGVAVPIHRVGVEDAAGTQNPPAFPQHGQGSRRCSSTALVKTTSKQSSGKAAASTVPVKTSSRAPFSQRRWPSAQLDSLGVPPILRATSSVAPALHPISSRLPVCRYRENRRSFQRLRTAGRGSWRRTGPAAR